MGGWGGGENEKIVLHFGQYYKSFSNTKRNSYSKKMRVGLKTVKNIELRDFLHL